MKRINIALVLILVLTLAGCASSSGYRAGDKEEQAIEVAAILRFADIPVPAGFKIDRNKSFTFQNDLTRVGLMRYSARAHVDRIVDFYKEQMPLYNWNLVNLVEYGKKILNFEKGSQSCIITMDSSGSTVFLTISLSPKGKGKAE